MKKIFLILFILITIFLIYFIAYQNNELTFSIGMEDGDITYNPSNYRITDIIIDIEDNIDIDNYKIQNILVKATTINVDINNYINVKDYQTILDQIDDLETLYKLLRTYSKENINIKLLNEKNILCEYANKKIILLSKKYDIMVVR